MVHRGPDEAGFCIVNGGRVGLANLRLSIIDIKNGHQPMYNEDQSVALVYNGEIYDIEECRQNLIKKGHRFITRSDTEVIVHLYEEYGMDFLDKINGEFAFILWDERKKTMYAGRDRHGIKPLFYHVNSNEFVFSSEIKGILSLDRIERKISPDYVMSTCITLYSPTDTFIDGIKSIRPGHYLEISDEYGLREKCYWKPRFNTDNSISFSEAKEGVQHYLVNAVRRRMIADVPVVVYLSGGVDSTLLCGIMAKLNQKLKAFNIGFNEAIYDESGIAEETAKFYNVDFQSVHCSMEMLADSFEKNLYHNEAVIVNPHSIAKQLLSAHVHQSGYKVCITGEGGDEYFGGYPYFRLEQIWRMLLSDSDTAKKGLKFLEEFKVKEAPTEFAMWDHNDKWNQNSSFVGYHSFFANRAIGAYEMFHKILDTEALGITSAQQPGNLIRRNYDFEYLRELHPFNASRFISLNQLYTYMIPLLGDRIEMANSVEGRLPYLDRDLAAFVSKLHPKYLLQMDNLREKHVLREAFNTELPPHIRKGKKHTFLSPNWDSFLATSRGHELEEELLSVDAIKRTGIFTEKIQNI
ncbi:asparagine synthase (glutamine-hydrolyzing) [Ruminiclostridium josui]|uniref:asparagine synthase (glutamine-hydrolyzing) n=1 Tax=Ruminiclostridium josui TaxID=1499 RepID=UPI0009EA8D14|nr:asparagine synthase (glutamine-hydrolyzing) [Ruminiclostridium josui]